MESFGNSYHMSQGLKKRRKICQCHRADRPYRTILVYKYSQWGLRNANFLLCEKCESLIGSTRYAPISLVQKSRGERSRHSSFLQTLTAVFIFISSFSSLELILRDSCALKNPSAFAVLKAPPSSTFFLSLYPTLLYTQTPEQHASCKNGGNQRGHSR